MKTKVGRPKGEEKVDLKLRVTPAQYKVLREKLTPGEISVLAKSYYSGWAAGEGDALAERIKQDAPRTEVPEINKAKEGNVKVADSGCDELKAQIKVLLDDNDRLQKEVDLFVVKRDNWMRATESQRVNAAMREVDKWKKAYLDGRSEFSQ